MNNEPGGGESPQSSSGQRAVFLSYASEDAAAAGLAAASLRAAGVEVWLDQSELKSGDAWDQRIRREIRTCALFIPVISRNTQARTEGYFRLEWHLADQRTHLMAKSRPFLVPVCVDDTPELHAEVPESFAAVQWTRLPAGQSSQAFVERVLRLISPEERLPAAPPPAGGPAVGASPPAAYQVGDLLVDVGQWRVTRAGHDIALPHLSFELLVELARAAPNLVTPDQLAGRVWPGLSITPETVSHRVKLVRDALGDDSHAPRYIAGVRGRGYRMVAAVHRVAATAGRAPPSGTEPLAAAPAEADRRPGAVRAPRVRPTWIWLGVAVLAIAAALTWLGTRKADSALNPLANARFSRLGGFEGVVREAAISRDGKLAAFLANRGGRNDLWLGEIGSGSYRNLTRDVQREFSAPREIRTLGFSADSSLVSIWTRNSDGSRPEDVNILAVPAAGGPLRSYLPETAEFDWSHDGRKLVFHTTAPGDPTYLREPGNPDRRIYVAPAGVHCHFPTWSPDDEFVYFVRGVPSESVWDIWRVRPSGSGAERLTNHNSNVAYLAFLDRRTLLYLASRPDSAGLWLYALDTETRVPHRVSLGLETYISLGASADGRRLLATVANPGRSLWRLPLAASDGAAPGPAPALLAADGAAPRLSRDYVLYVAGRGGEQGIWTLTQGASREIWSSPHALIVGVPAISPDGRRIAFVAREDDRTTLYVIDGDGAHPTVIADALELRGNPAWAPDGQSILIGVVREEEPRLTSIFLNRAQPVTLVADYSTDPVWSPDGRFLVYSGADIATTFPVRAAGRDGRPWPLPTLILTRGARHVAFTRDGRSLVFLRGDFEHKDLWVMDLASGAEHALARLPADFVIGDFDVAPDGSEIVFDRVQESSELALIERGR